MDPLMSLSEYNVIESLCRCCLSEDVELKPLFVTSDVLHCLPYLFIAQICDVIICPNDSLPSQICLDCIDRLHLIHKFKQQVLNSQRILNEHFNKAGTASPTKVIKSLTDLLIQKIYNCQTCDKKFNTEFNLLRHKKTCARNDTAKTLSKEVVANDDGLNLNFGLDSLMDIEELDDMLTVDPVLTYSSVKKEHLGDSQQLVEAVIGRSLRQKNKKRCQKRRRDDSLDRYKKGLKFKSKGIFVCDHCEYEFKELNTLTNHLKDVMLRESNECTFCNMKFEDKSSVVRHVKGTHDGNKPYTCDRCQGKFRTLEILQIHTRCKHTKEKTVCCPRCPKKFILQRDLNRHLKSHDSPYVCNICNKSFKYKFYLANHKKSHSKNVEQTCDDCGHVFSNEQKLSRHKKVAHTGQSHKCSDCKKVFTHKSRLQKHQLSHTASNARKMKCAYCDKRFNHKHHLTNHEMTHTHVRPFLCSLCGKGYIQYNHLKKHLKFHENSNKHTCSHCSHSFAFLKDFREHMKEKHSNSKEADVVKDTKVNVKKKSPTKRDLKKVKVTKTVLPTADESNVRTCTICQHSFSRIGRPKQRVVEDADSDLCNACEAKFKTKFKLNQTKHVNSNVKVKKTASGSQSSDSQVVEKLDGLYNLILYN